MRVAVVGVGHLGKHHARILASLPGEWQVTMDELEAALSTVQSVEPTGFAAQSLSGAAATGSSPLKRLSTSA